MGLLGYLFVFFPHYNLQLKKSLPNCCTHTHLADYYVLLLKNGLDSFHSNFFQFHFLDLG